MEALSSRDREIEEIGASLAINCVHCIDHHIKEAKNIGVTNAQIREAVELPNMVKNVPAKTVLEYAYSKLEESTVGDD